MPKDKTQSQIADALKAIGNELVKLANAVAEETREEMRAEAFDSVQRMFGVAPHANGVKPKTKGKAGGAFSPKSTKRTGNDIAAQASKLFTYINAHPGERAETIAKAIGATTKELPRPIKLLLGEKKIKASGVARGTTYTAT